MNEPNKDFVPMAPKRPRKWAGLGDAVEAVAKVTGIAAATKAVEAVTGKPCGCQGRKAALNKAVPFTRPAQTDDPSLEDLPEAG
tara:strand:+ start:295 stop:546 length:252 start_codon:yes stop_codon:yes gene_type:complete